MPSLVDIVNADSTTTLDEIKDVPPLPTGSYLAMVVGNYEAVKSNQKQTDGLQFTLRLVQARDDVDQDALQGHLEASNRGLMDVTLRHTIWDSPYALTSLRDFLRDALGIDGNLPPRQALAEVPGRQLVVNIIHRPFTDNAGNARLRAEIGSTARAL